MSKLLLPTLVAGALALAASSAPAAPQVPERQPRAQIEFVDVGGEITLRRLIVRKPESKGVVLLLHGFPETLHAWEAVAEQLAGDYEIHAFDWPGYGLSSRPPVERFAYAPADYARVLKGYIATAGIDRFKLTIYATDIGALPALLLALEEPDIARRIIVGDFAPFDRPEYMYASLQSLKSPASAELVRAQFNRNRDEILVNTFSRGLPGETSVEISSAFKEDLSLGWDHGALTSADAFAHYYAGFTSAQSLLERDIARLKTPVTVLWGEKDLYIGKQMGIDFTGAIGTKPILLAGVGHYPHLQEAERVAAEIRAASAPTPD